MGQLSNQNKTLSQVGCFALVQCKKKDKKWYEVRCEAWTLEHEVEHEIRNFFDPLRNKGGRWGSHWKYSNRKDAEQMYATALLKFS